MTISESSSNSDDWSLKQKFKTLSDPRIFSKVFQSNVNWILNFLVFVFGTVAAVGGYRSSSAVVTVCGVGAALGALLTFIFARRSSRDQQLDEARLRHLEMQLSNLEAQLELGSLGDFGLVGTGEKGEKVLSLPMLDSYFTRDDIGGRGPLIPGVDPSLAPRPDEARVLEWCFRDEYEY
ncbi:hypothetical protein D9757_006748 [Collybiopsis confluens]|uniref:Uncharacterized protein n=1 Tax=Collybiopsis confluens TaxID=2823264 RepID=A0A8H5HLI0_9AGAR|nr:hypothetical protein D9757_006748 [Collybiopsis confluens]